MDMIETAEGGRQLTDTTCVRRLWIGALLLGAVAVAPLRAQESGIPVGTTAPGAKLELLDGSGNTLGERDVTPSPVVGGKMSLGF